MERAPRGAGERLFTKRMVVVSLAQGAAALAAVFGVYAWSTGAGMAATEVRGLAFTTLVVANLGLIFVNRSWSTTVAGGIRKPNRALWWVVGSAIVLLATLLTVPGVRGVFALSAIRPADLAVAVGAGLVAVSWFEAYKTLRRRRREQVA